MSTGDTFRKQNAQRRLALVLLDLSQRMGHPCEDGGIEIVPLTPRSLASAAGMSMATLEELERLLRDQGCLWFSPSGVVLYPDALKDKLRWEG